MEELFDDGYLYSETDPLLFDNDPLLSSVANKDSWNTSAYESYICHHNSSSESEDSSNSNSDSDLEMEHYPKLHVKRFSGYTTDDAEQFLSDFEAYVIFTKLDLNEQRRIAAFQLHLCGPAQVWYSSLDSAYKLRWDTVLQKFKEEYHLNKPVLLVETEIFQNVRLLNGQQLEDYFSKVVDKGRKINKSAQEILLKFIEGLPSQLAFFVRAGNPENMHQITSVTPPAVVAAISQPDLIEVTAWACLTVFISYL